MNYVINNLIHKPQEIFAFKLSSKRDSPFVFITFISVYVLPSHVLVTEEGKDFLSMTLAYSCDDMFMLGSLNFFWPDFLDFFRLQRLGSYSFIDLGPWPSFLHLILGCQTCYAFYMVSFFRV